MNLLFIENQALFKKVKVCIINFTFYFKDWQKYIYKIEISICHFNMDKLIISILRNLESKRI